MFGDPRDLKDMVSFEGFDPDDYHNGEKNILQPQIEACGYTNVEWYSEVHPVTQEETRLAKARGGKTHSLIGAEGKLFYFYYR